jgi:hypothetical protein
LKKKTITRFTILFCLIFSFSSLPAQDNDYTYLLKKNKKGEYNKHGWNHYGPGYFTLDTQTGVLQAHDGMGLFWFSEKKFKSFILELDFKTNMEKANSGIFIRVPQVPTSNIYIHQCFEVQIYDKGDSTHTTGAIYDSHAPTSKQSYGPNKWNHFKITCMGDNIKVELNGTLVNDWDMKTPIGKIKEMYPEGYIGLQNHDKDTTTYFKNIKVKELN